MTILCFLLTLCTELGRWIFFCIIASPNLKPAMARCGILFFITALFLQFSSPLFAQDPEFTQFYAHPLYLNPAFAGTAKCPRAVMIYRNEWPDIHGTYTTYSASYDQHIDVLSGGLGFLVTEDNQGAGTFSKLEASGIYSYQLNVTRRFSLRFAMQGTYAQRKLDWSKLTFGDMIDQRLGFVYNTNEVRGPSSTSYFDASSGILGFSKRYFFGVAVHHLTQPNEALYSSAPSPLPMKITAHAGAVIPLDDKGNASISPNIIFLSQDKQQQLCLGVYASKGPIVAGLWYREGFTNPDSFIALIGIQYNIFKFGYSYDITVSKLSNAATAGSHEISLAMNFACTSKTKKFRTVNCPSF